MATTLKPLGDRVVVKPKKKEETTSSGLVLPDTASEKPQEGSVIAGLHQSVHQPSRREHPNSISSLTGR